MNKGILILVKRSLVFYRTPLFFQFFTTAFLAAIIAASLLTGSSVRQTLRETIEKKLSNTGIVISSGLRYFDPDLDKKLQRELNRSCVSILELKGFSSHFSTGKSAVNVRIFGIQDAFFRLDRYGPGKELQPGEALINQKLADRLGAVVGDDIIIRFSDISDIPLNAPFAPEGDRVESIILTVKAIAEGDSYDHFNLGISQIKPLNLFLDLSDFEDAFGGKIKANRLLVENDSLNNVAKVEQALKKVLAPEDVGLSIRRIEALNQHEIVSDRIFFDEATLEVIARASPKAIPLLSYLANSIDANGRSTPYSFVSAIPANFFPLDPSGENIIINNWLADDLNAGPGDRVVLSYYMSDHQNNLSEASSEFIVDRIVDIDGPWGDPMLMPEFPGISGSTSCSSWDAGVTIDSTKIRAKDEAYWYRYKGTPKAFISYTEGARLWGNNFGRATALRFTDATESDIRADLSRQLEPGKLGFSIRDVYTEGIKAAETGVDFSTLFLSLSFFIIASSVLLLSLLVSSFFETRKGQIKTLFSLGFKTGTIARILLYETALIAFLASLAGVFLGLPFNSMIIYALNSVWEGAVQTNTLSPHADPGMLFLAFTGSFLISLVVLLIRTRRFLNRLDIDQPRRINRRKVRYASRLFPLFAGIAVLPFLAVYIFPAQSTALFFLGGTLLFVTLLLFFRWVIQWIAPQGEGSIHALKRYSWLYFAFYPSQALIPIIFIAAGLFIIVVTGVNRKSFEGDYLSNQSGTGGYFLWGETMTPIREDLNDPSDRKKIGLDREEEADLSFLQALKLEGDDASCLNLNHIATPSLLGIDSGPLSREGRFAFAKTLEGLEVDNPWEALKLPAKGNTIYGIADQTVLDWGLKLDVGDKLSIVGENGKPLHIVIAGGLEPSVFQGYVLIGRENFSRFLPAIAGSAIFLAQGIPQKRALYKKRIVERLSGYGLDVEFTEDRLSAFYEVTNTYLTVFMTLGGLGMLLGILGLGLAVVRNFEYRKKEFAFLIVNGFTFPKLRSLVYKEYLVILFAGISSGMIPAVIATLPSISTGVEIPWMLLVTIVLAISISGMLIIRAATGRIGENELIALIRKD